MVEQGLGHSSSSLTISAQHLRPADGKVLLSAGAETFSATLAATHSPLSVSSSEKSAHRRLVLRVVFPLTDAWNPPGRKCYKIAHFPSDPPKWGKLAPKKGKKHAENAIL